MPAALNLNFCLERGLEQFAYSDFGNLAGLIKMPKQGVYF